MSTYLNNVFTKTANDTCNRETDPPTPTEPPVYTADTHKQDMHTFQLHPFRYSLSCLFGSKNHVCVFSPLPAAHVVYSLSPLCELKL